MGVLGMSRGKFYSLYAGTLIAIRHEQVLVHIHHLIKTVE